MAKFAHVEIPAVPSPFFGTMRQAADAPVIEIQKQRYENDTS